MPRIPSMRILDLALAIDPSATLNEIGMRPGEKLHEEMISAEDSSRTVVLNDRFVVTPVIAEWGYVLPSGSTMLEGSAYRSDTNDLWMTQKEIRNFLAEIQLR